MAPRMTNPSLVIPGALQPLLDLTEVIDGTGTTSLKAALERLGSGPCFHMFDVVDDERRPRQWEEIVCVGRSPDREAVFDGYAAAVDGPCAIYHRRLKEVFPQAKMILTVRDAERWCRGAHETPDQFAPQSRVNPPEPSSRRARLFRITDTMVRDGLFGGRFHELRTTPSRSIGGTTRIIAAFGADLLVYDVRQGWEPLCAFPGVEVPKEDCPRSPGGLANVRPLRRHPSKPGERHGRVPADGIGHAFLALPDDMCMSCPCSWEYAPGTVIDIDALDPDPALPWNLTGPLIRSAKDAVASTLAEAAAGILPAYAQCRRLPPLVNGRNRDV